jgi:hypothetical protein
LHQRTLDIGATYLKSARIFILITTALAPWSAIG